MEVASRDGRGEQVVGGRRRVNVARQVQVELVHRDHLRVASSGGTSLDAKRRTLTRLTHARERRLAEVGAERLRESDRRRRLALSERGRRDAGDDDVLAVAAVLERVEDLELDLCLVAAVHLEVLGRNPDLGREEVDRFRHLGFRDLNVGRHVLFADELERLDEALLALLEQAFGRQDRVLHEHRDRHRSDSSRHRRDVRRLVDGRVKVDVADEARARLARRVVDEVGPDVDHDRARLDPVALDEARLADRGDDNVGLLDDRREVLCARVALGHGRVFAAEEGAHGRADNVAASEHDGVLAADVDPGRLEEEHDAGGGARRKEGFRRARREEANVVRVEAVDVLLGRDGLGDAALAVAANVVGEGQLDNDAVHAVVLVEAVDLGHDLDLADAVLESTELDQGALDAGLGRRLEFHLDVGRRVGARALLDDGEVRFEPRELGARVCDALRDSLAERAVMSRAHTWGQP